MTNEKAIEMFVGGLVLDPNTEAPVVVLKDESGDIHLPIWIGMGEATSIASAIKQLHMPRPLTHDLIADILSQTDITVQRVLITELKDSTYFAELVLSIGDKAIIMDSRPSDAIAIALRTSAPIFVAEEVLTQAQVSFQIVGMPPEEEGGIEEPAGGAAPAVEGEEREEGDSRPSSKDFKNIDKEKWDELLKDLDPDDFKYKM